MMPFKMIRLRASSYILDKSNRFKAFLWKMSTVLRISKEFVAKTERTKSMDVTTTKGLAIYEVNPFIADRMSPESFKIANVQPI